ncbi:hypothetical protein D3C87_2141800 [compost metagenome]
MCRDDIGNLSPDRKQRVEIGHRVLEDHRDADTADLRPVLLRQVGYVLPVKRDGAFDDFRIARADAEHRTHQNGLA